MLARIKDGALGRVLIVAVALCLSTLLAMRPLSAGATEYTSGSWLVATAKGGLSQSHPEWLFAVDSQLRYVDIGEGLYEYLLRPSIGYAVTPSLKVWLGYARFRNKINPFTSTENRPWQQVDWVDRDLLGGQLALRLRTEQRNVSFSDDRRHVLRLRARYQRNIAADVFSDWFVSVEPFVDMNTSDWGGGTGISQNRLQLGLGIPIAPKVRLEAAYMQQYFYVDGSENRANNLAFLSINWSF